MSDTRALAEPLALPCGATLPNRIVKAAMSEGLADADNHATPRLETLYRRWAGSGAGLLLSGNIQVDRWHLERPGNVVLDDDRGLGALAAMVQAGRAEGAAFWAQLSHTGRQVLDQINAAPLSPSDVEIDIGRVAGFSFARPRTMTEGQILTAIEQFAAAARRARDAGFDGVQLHAAHGYLFSQFLSPLANRRTDRWGGPLENRARFLLRRLSGRARRRGSGRPLAGRPVDGAGGRDGPTLPRRGLPPAQGRAAGGRDEARRRRKRFPVLAPGRPAGQPAGHGPPGPGLPPGRAPRRGPDDHPRESDADAHLGLAVRPGPSQRRHRRGGAGGRSRRLRRLWPGQVPQGRPGPGGDAFFGPGSEDWRGHLGDAYGLLTGLFWNLKDGRTLVWALNGVRETGRQAGRARP